MAMLLGLEGKAVLVTGATRGIGRAIAEGFARENARLVILARDRERLDDARGQLLTLGAADVVSVAGDVAIADQLAKAVELSITKFGSLSVVVCNAGGPPAGGFGDCTDAMWDEGYQRTFLPLIRLARLALPHMRMAKAGRIIQVSSVAARQPMERLTISSSFRAGLLGVVRSLAAEVAMDNITVNCVLPGFTRTEHVEELAQTMAQQRGCRVHDVLSQWVAVTPAGRLLEPSEIADAVLFLASERATGITGIGLPVDGGFLRGIG